MGSPTQGRPGPQKVVDVDDGPLLGCYGRGQRYRPLPLIQ
jgi:hypothetical protein